MSEDEISVADKLRAQGLDVETVGDIIGDGPAPEVKPFVMPVLDGYPVEWPGEGIFFGMDEETYHAIPAGSNGGIKKLAASPMLYWADCRWLNYDYEEREEKEHFDTGHAVHCRVLEGREAFQARFAVGLDKKDYPNALDTLKEIRAAWPDGIKPKGASKRECFDNLKVYDATVELWDDLLAEHEKANEGKTMIPAKTVRQIEIAAAIMEKDPELSAALRGGYPEVVLLWICRKTGVPMKAKADYLKTKMIVDLKTIANQKEQSIENAIRFEIANRRYGIQPSVYLEGAKVVRQLVRERGEEAIFDWPSMTRDGKLAISPEEAKRIDEQREWVRKWASHTLPDEFMFIFQQKGAAPVARGLFWPRAGTTRMLCDDIMMRMKRRLRTFSETFGCDPWLDVAPVYDLADEDLPPWSSEI